MANDSLLILGAGGHAHSVEEIAKYNKSVLGPIKNINFLDDNLSLNSEGPLSLCNSKDFKKKFRYAAVGIGNPEIRLFWLDYLKRIGYECPFLVHKTAWVCDNTVIEEGSVIMPNSIIMPNSRVGLGCIINTSSSVDHDCILEKGVHIAPGCNLAGNITIREKTMIGIGSNIIQGISIGSDVIVGAGSSVIKDIESNQIVVGNPANPIHRNK